jgi:hypothetical protein
MQSVGAGVGACVGVGVGGAGLICLGSSGCERDPRPYLKSGMMHRIMEIRFANSKKPTSLHYL